MKDTDHFRTIINKRLATLGQRMEEIDTELGRPKEQDLEDQAVDLEDDEVLEGLGQAAQQEVALLNDALRRIDDGTYGICRTCEEPISRERLEAVPYAQLCRRCAGAGTAAT